MSYDFRYSKLAPNSILGFLFILIFVLVGLVISIIILFYIINYKILETKEATFWKEHQKLVFSSISKNIAFFIKLFLIIKTLHTKKINNTNIKNVIFIESNLNTPFYRKYLTFNLITFIIC